MHSTVRNDLNLNLAFGVNSLFVLSSLNLCVGLVLKENKRYSQTVKKAFHISSAALDLDSVKSNEWVQVWVNSDGNNHLLCSLNQTHPNVALDIPFSEGEQIALFGKGAGTAHLTGYLAEEEPDFDFGEEASDEEDEEVP